MQIRTEDEHHAAVAEFQERGAIARGRSMTDDEQCAFDDLDRDITAYEAWRDSRGGQHPTPVSGSRSREPDSRAAPTPTSGLQAGISQSVTSMQRTLRRQGLVASEDAPAASSAGANSMQRTLRRMGLAPQAGR